MLNLKNKKLILPALSLICILFLATILPAIRASLFNPLGYPLTVLSLIKREISGLIFYHRNFIQKNLLSKENDFLKNKLNNFDELKTENRRLKELLTLKEASEYKMVAALVIARSPDSWSSSIIINKGRSSGIRRGQVVINYLGLVGRVIEAGDSNSKVMLINDPGFSVSAMTKRSRQEGLVNGVLGNSLIMKYLLQDTDIKPDDLILTSGLTLIFPKGIIIGSVVSVEDEFSGFGRYAIVRPAVNLSAVEEVLVVIR